MKIDFNLKLWFGVAAIAIIVLGIAVLLMEPNTAEGPAIPPPAAQHR